MNSPFNGNFMVTQAFSSSHDGLDLVGLQDKQIHSTVNGTVIHAGWENPSNPYQGFGQYVCIRTGNQDYYYGHMSQIYVSVGQTVKVTDIIGREGSTGYSTGSHCHYCCRVAGTRTPLDICAISGIPNVEGGVYNDGGSGGSIPGGGAAGGGTPNGGSLSDAFQMSYLSGGGWTNFNNQAMAYMDGIKIQTAKSRDYYLQYRTWNQGQGGFYPYVKSNENDYAGSSGKPIQLLQIQAYKNDGTKLTTGIVVMYRVHVGGRWLPWVSNADPEWMQSVFTKHNLDGSLDTASADAGLSGQNIDGVEIRVYECNSQSGGGNFSNGEIASHISYMVDGGWEDMGTGVLVDHMDGLKILTSTDQSYYLSYRTKNQGQGDFYPAVTSLEDDYAGSSGKPIQLVSIRALQHDGTSLTSGVIVMYRAFVGGRWLPWVSNADPQWMQSIQNKFSLGGTLDTTSYYAGIDGQNISGLEIRIFEDGSSNPGSGNFQGSEISLTTTYMVDNHGNWNSFDKTVTASHIDGLKIQTNSTQDFYLTYQTWNQGQGGFYPNVTSLENDYAGSAGKPIQLLSIRAYKPDGTKLTTGVVIMYRALVNGRWLPWVSNADPDWMDSVKSQYNLDGTLDYTSYYAGIDGQNISGLEIRAFVGTTNNTPIEGLTGQEAPPALSYMVNGSWTNFTNSVIPGRLDGLKIQTDKNKGYYISYQTWNQGQGYWYPEVTSTQDDYAGSAGKPIQLFGLHVYRNDGTKLTTGVVVMYRAYVDGRWLPWVSNADPEWMRSVQAKYNLDGTLDTSGYDAGIAGKNISGIEVRVFEENSTEVPPPTPTGKSHIIDAPFIDQTRYWPTGCESVSAVMALQYAGINMSVDTFIDNYLPIISRSYKIENFDPDLNFYGNPRDNTGYGCYAPVIKNCLDRILTNPIYSTKMIKGASIQDLCSEYIDKDIPVILWATMEMQAPRVGPTWKTLLGKTVVWMQPEHCLLLVGYDDRYYYFNDPRQRKQMAYLKAAVEVAYAGLFKQAVVIEKNPIVEDPKTAIIVIPGIMGSELFEGTKSYENRLWNPTPPSMVDGPKKILRLVCNPDGSSVNPVYADNLDYGALGTYKELYNKLYENYAGQYVVDYFPYDWRMSCSEAGAKLDNFINDKGYKKVILVAHSMGGLVASNYIMTLKVKEQLYKVDKLITLGTPFLGAPKLVDVFLNGNALDDAMTDWWLNITGAIPGIMPNMKSIYELLPTQQWFTTANKTLFTYTNYYNVPGHPDEGVPTVSTTYSDTRTRLYEKMDNINMSLLSKAENMHNHLFSGSSHITSFVDSYYIAGVNKSTNTAIKSNIMVETGKLESMSFPKTNLGDGTVPVWSANLGGNYPDKAYYAANREHGGAIHDDGSVTEGLVVSNNVIQMVKNIINNNSKTLPAGITQTPPTN